TMLVSLTLAVSAIVYTMAQMFHTDKLTYMRGLTAEMAMHAAAEAGAVLNGYHKRFKVFSHILFDMELYQQQKTDIIKYLFAEFPEFVAVAIYQNGEEIAAVYDIKMFEANGLTKAMLQDHRRKHPLPFERIRRSEYYLENSTFSKAFPILTLAMAYDRPNSEDNFIVTAVIRLEQLIELVNRSKIFLTYIVDKTGLPLVYPDADAMSLKVPVQWIRDTDLSQHTGTEGISMQFRQNDIPMIGAAAHLDFGDYLAGVQIPLSAAYLTSKALLKNLTLVATVILILGTLFSMISSRLLTKTFRQLSAAAKRIGQGDFDVTVSAPCRDEIGGLVQSFNQMARELQARKAALEKAQSALVQSEKMAAFGQISAGIAHEVKNPVAGILGLTQVTLRKADRTTLLGQNLAAIEKEAKRCKTIIENLLKFAREEKMSFNPVAINQVIKDTINLVAPQYHLQNIDIDLHLEQDLPTIQGNAVQLQQVIFNILINAQQAINEGPGCVDISATCPSGSRIVIRISDSGPGLQEENPKKIFEPFYTTKEVGQGTGLGLSVSYGIIRAHKGDIRVNSPRGKGAEFIITLPVDPEAKPE
ncbi:MAG: ATP-binding protein, partial [Desulfobacteraceae bacterium]